MKWLLPNLTARLQRFKDAQKAVEVPRFLVPVPPEDNNIISHAWFWPRLGHFFKPKDIIIAETGKFIPATTAKHLRDSAAGTANFGILEVPLPEEVVFVTQILWGSIGYTTGATLGAALAGRQLKLGRPILFIGDGSL
jgi:pyruvate decarboxylase